MNFRKMFTMSISTFCLFNSGMCSAFSGLKFGANANEEFQAVQAQFQEQAAKLQNLQNQVFSQFSKIQGQSGLFSGSQPETGSQPPAQKDEQSKPETDLDSNVETSEEDDDSSVPATSAENDDFLDDDDYDED